ncbi:MAG: DUF1634 domain-containing protein [Bryobacterales bacterium]|nr:DUF1634 domain-containing protein [Bryobacterales bacterium]
MTGSRGHSLEVRLGGLLRTGVLLAALFVIAGGSVYLVRHGGEQPSYGHFEGEPAAYRTVAGILQGVVNLSGRAIIQFGLLVLIATPIARVATAGFGFARRRDWTYVVICSVVLALLLYGLVSGK